MRPIALKLTRWFDHNARDLPWRRTHDPYAIWISEIMLQQTQVKTVIPFFQRWMRALPTIEAFACAPSPAALKLWEGLGYYSRVRNAHAAARCIMREHAGVSRAILPASWPCPAWAVTPPARLQHRLQSTRPHSGRQHDPRLEPGPRSLRQSARQGCQCKALEGRPTTGFAPGIQPAKLNQAMMELGALVCLPRQPNCPHCPLRRDCFACRENRVAEFPALARSAPPTRRHFIALVVRRRGPVPVSAPGRRGQRGSVGISQFRVPPGTNNPSTLAAPFHIAPGEPFLRVRHSITRHRIL